jgi:hypothetical protein
MRITFRVRYMTSPHIPHVYCRVFCATNGSNYESCGNLTMRKDEFVAFSTSFTAEFIEDVDP